MRQCSSSETLLLQLLTMSGDIAVPDDAGNSLLSRTIEDCREAGWISVTKFAAGFRKVALTSSGKALAKGASADGT